jgi:hypothetical protein
VTLFLYESIIENSGVNLQILASKISYQGKAEACLFMLFRPVRNLSGQERFPTLREWQTEIQIGRENIEMLSMAPVQMLQYQNFYEGEDLCFHFI